MTWWGKLVGSGIGLLGGPWAALAGGAIGHFFDQENQTPEEELRAKLLYHALFFSAAAKIAKADGKISYNEILIVESLIQKFGLHPKQEKFAKDIFRKSKASQRPISQDFKDCGKLIQFNSALAHSFLGGLWEIVKANGYPHSSTQVKCLLIGEEILKIQPGTVKSWFIHGQTHHKTSPSQKESDLDASYRTLGVDPSLDFAQIKKIFRAKIMMVHPDQVKSKALPQDLLVFAHEQAVRLNLAFEAIKRAKGFK